MPIRTLNVAGLILSVVGFVMLAFFMIRWLFAGIPPALSNPLYIALGLVVVGWIAAYLRDGEVPTDEGLREIALTRQAHTASIFLFGFTMLAVVVWFFFWKRAVYDPTLYLAVFVGALVVSLMSTISLFLEPNRVAPATADEF